MFTKTTESYFFSVAVSTAVVCCVAFLLLTIGIGSQFVPTAHAEPTPTINYQGKLTDTNGLAVPDGTYNMRFWLLQSEAQATTSALWTESLTGSNKVQVTDGLFSIMLGSTSALTSVDFNQTLYLGVEIGGSTTPAWDGEMSPRKPLGTVPASFESYKLGGVASSSFLRSDQADTISASTASTLLTIIQNGVGDILNIFDGATEVFTILDGGNVGIGSSSPNSKLTIAGNTNIDSYTNLPGYFINSMPAVTGSTTLNNFFFAGASSTSYYFGGYNYAIGDGALTNLNWGSNNIAIGQNAMKASGTAATNFSNNNALGKDALFSITSGSNNNALGEGTLSTNTTGGGNNAFGYQALTSNVSGGGNNALGGWALRFNTTGMNNNAIGPNAMQANTSGSYNNVLGTDALYTNTTGSYNNAFGYNAMYSNTVGSHNNAIGEAALGYNTTGLRNNAFGYSALLNNNGTGTIAIGYQTADNATGVDRGIFIGYDIDAFSTTQDDVLNIGNLIFGNSVNGTGQNISTGNIGIATTSSTARLTVQSTGTSDILNLFETGGSEVFTVLESGNVGIGTSSPYAKLGVAGNLVATGVINTQTNSANTFAGHLDINGTATSTFANGIELEGGCFRDQSGTCISAQGDTQIVVAANDTDVNLKAYADYVADGTNDQDEIQSAIDYVYANGGGTVHLLAGTFTVGTTTYTDSAIRLATSTQLIGQGDATVIKLRNSFNANISIVHAYNVQDVYVGHLAVDGNKANQSGGTDYGVNLQNTGSSTVENTYVHSLFYYGINVQGNNNNVVSNTVHNNQLRGIQLTGSYNTASHNMISDNGSWGIFVDGSMSNVTNNIIKNNPTGIRVNASSNTISGNQISQSTTYGIDLSSSASYNIINSNDIIVNAGIGIYLNFVTGYNTISGNNVYFNGYGIYLNTSANNTVTANNFSENSYGIYGTCFACVLNANTLTGNDTAIYLVNGGLVSSNSITNNQLIDNGGTGATSSITLVNEDNALLSGNRIYDTAGSGYAIDIDAASSNVTLADNVYSGTGATAIRDLSSNTEYTEHNRITVNATDSDFASGAYTALKITQSGTGDIANFFDGSNEVLTILDGGNVGIGTTTPTALLTVGSSTASYLTAGNLYNSALVSGALEVGGLSHLGGGLMSYASSTFLSGLSIVGNATTTGTLIVQGTGTSTFGGGLQTTGNLDINGTATSTFANGIELEGGCFRDQSGTCITSGTYGDTQVVVAASDSASNEKALADYTADGTNDQDEIQSAIDYVYANGGGTVHLLAGTFTVGTTTYTDSAIRLATSTQLIGQGKATVIKLRDNFNNNINIVHAYNVQDVYVGHLAVDGNRDNQGSGYNAGVYLEAGSSTVQYTYEHDLRGAGIVVQGFGVAGGGNNNRIISNVANSNDTGISISNSDNNIISGNTASNNDTYTTSSGIYLSVSKYNTISNNITNYNGQHGIYLNGTVWYNTISNNVADGNTYDGIRLSSIKNSTIISNSLSNNGLAGIGLSVGVRNTITGNSIYNNVYGLWHSNGSNNSISANFIEENDYGIYMNPGNSNTVTGNYLYSNGGSSATSSITLISSDNNIFDGNYIYDTAGTGYAIDIDASSDNNVLANNVYSGTGATAIRDLSSNTKYTEHNRITVNATDSDFASGAYTALTITQSGTGNIAQFFDGGTEAFTIMDGGNVGIGATSTSDKLTIAGNTNVSSYTNLPGYFINSMPAVTGSTTLNNFFFAGATSSSFYLGSHNYAMGNGALTNLGQGSYNFAVGGNALAGSSTAGMHGSSNIALGYSTLFSNVWGEHNNALGNEALYSNTNGGGNNALGYQALRYSTTGGANNALGYQALFSNVTGHRNNALGYQTLFYNTTGADNNAIGDSALFVNSIGSRNNAIGYNTIFNNTVGSDNNAIGHNALYSNTTGSRNNALGYHTLYSNNGTGTIAIGYQTADNALSVDRSIFIGYNIDAFSTTADDQLNIGNLIFGNNVNGTGQTISSGNIGIATTSSTARLTVQSTGTSDILNLFETGGSEVFTVLESGNVGIGTSSPYAKLSVLETGGGSKSLFVIASSTGGTPSGVFAVDAYGRVGIGSTSPKASLFIADTVGNNGVSIAETEYPDWMGDGGIFMKGAVFAKGGYIAENSDTFRWGDSSTRIGGVGSSGTGYFTFDTESTERMRLTGSGYLGIGTTTPNSKLTVNGTTTIGMYGATSTQAGLQIGFGGICVDNDGSCVASTTGRISAVNFHTGNSDLAEMYFSDVELLPGELVSLISGFSVDRASKKDSAPVLGVVSTKPGLLLGHDDTSLNEGETGYPIALSGRVPVKISTENGVIKRGDQLMLSSLPGIAMKATGTGMVVGIALEDFNEGRKYSDGYINQVNDDLGTTTPEEVEEIARKMIKERTDTEYLDNGTTVRVGQVVMFVNSSYRWLDDRELAGLQTLMSTSNITVFGKNENETLFDRLVMLANRFVDGILSVFELRANRVEVADELCVDDVCVTADDLRALLQDDERLSGGNNNTAVPDTDDNGGATPDVDTDGDYTSTVKDEQQPEEDNIDVPIESVSDDAVAGNSTDGDLGSESTLSTEQTTETEEESTVSESESESETVANEETSIEEAAPGVTTEEPTT